MVWWKIVTHLTANDLRIGRVLSSWQAFFKLRCDDKDQFFSFYSKTKEIIHKLKTAKSDAVKDDHFLRAFFARAIDVPDLSEITKKFLTVFNKTTKEILDLVHIDFSSAVNTKELLEDGSTTAGGGESNLRRANNNNDKSKVNFTNSKSKPVTKVVFRAFPKNTGEPFPKQVYKQMREWYAHAAKPEEEKTTEDKSFLAKFKFQAWKPKENFHKRGGDHKHRGYANRNARRAECQYSEEHGYDDRRDYSRSDNQGGGANSGYQRNNERGYSRERSRDDRGPPNGGSGINARRTMFGR